MVGRSVCPSVRKISSPISGWPKKEHQDFHQVGFQSKYWILEIKFGFYRGTLRCPLQYEHMCYFQRDHVADWQYETIPLILHQDSHTRTHTELIRRLTFQRDTHLWEYNCTKWNAAVVSLIASSSQVTSSPMSHSYPGSEIIWCNVISFFPFQDHF